MCHNYFITVMILVTWDNFY